MLGIVCEYNPFHNGHAYHIARSRQEIEDDDPEGGPDDAGRKKFKLPF